MSNSQDVAFGFDPKPFLNGIKQVTKGLDGLTSNTKKAADGIGKSMFWAMAKIEALKFAFRKVTGFVKSLGKYMPELGKSFEIAKDIIFKNLLWPLRQELAPLLQNMLDWVRDNRALFIRFGEALAGAFRVGVQLAQSMYRMLQNLLNIIRPAFERVFGDMSGGISEAIDLVLAKAAIIAAFVGRTLSVVFANLVGLAEKLAPTFESIIGHVADFVTSMFSANKSGDSLLTLFEKIWALASDIVEFIAEMADGFLSGFVPAISEAMTPLNEIFESLGRLMDRFFTGDEAREKWKAAFEFFGQVVGETLHGALVIVADAIENIVLGIEFAADKIKEFSDWGKGLLSDFGENSDGAGRDAWSADPRTFAERMNAAQVNDAIIKPDGTIIRTHPNDTIVATQSPVELSRGDVTPAPVELSRDDVGGRQMQGGPLRVDQNVSVQLVVSEGNAEKAGRNFGEGLSRSLGTVILDSMVYEGY